MALVEVEAGAPVAQVDALAQEVVAVRAQLGAVQDRPRRREAFDRCPRQCVARRRVTRWQSLRKISFFFLRDLRRDRRHERSWFRRRFRA